MKETRYWKTEHLVFPSNSNQQSPGNILSRSTKWFVYSLLHFTKLPLWLLLFTSKERWGLQQWPKNTASLPSSASSHGSPALWSQAWHKLCPPLLAFRQQCWASVVLLHRVAKNLGSHGSTLPNSAQKWHLALPWQKCLGPVMSSFLWYGWGATGRALRRGHQQAQVRGAWGGLASSAHPSKIPCPKSSGI